MFLVSAIGNLERRVQRIVDLGECYLFVYLFATALVLKFATNVILPSLSILGSLTGNFNMLCCWDAVRSWHSLPLALDHPRHSLQIKLSLQIVARIPSVTCCTSTCCLKSVTCVAFRVLCLVVPDRPYNASHQVEMDSALNHDRLVCLQWLTLVSRGSVNSNVSLRSRMQPPLTIMLKFFPTTGVLWSWEQSVRHETAAAECKASECMS